MAAELCGRGSVVEHHLAKVRVASSNLVARSVKQQVREPFSSFPIRSCSPVRYTCGICAANVMLALLITPPGSSSNLVEAY